jgi:hypothetical protein
MVSLCETPLSEAFLSTLPEAEGPSITNSHGSIDAQSDPASDDDSLAKVSMGNRFGLAKLTILASLRIEGVSRVNVSMYVCIIQDL